MAQNLYGEFDQILKQAAVDGLDEKQVQQYALDLLKTRVIEPLKAKGANADTINRGTQLFWNRVQGVIVANGFNQAPNESVEDMMQRRADIAASNSSTLSAVRDAKTVAKGVGFALSAPFRKYAAGANNLAASGATLLNDYLNTDENGVPLTDTGLAQFAQSQKDAANAHRAAVPAYKSDNTFAGDLMQNASELGGSITESLPTLVLGGGIGGAAAKGVMALKGAGATAKTAVAAGLTGAVAASPVEFSANYGEARDKTIQTLSAQKEDGTFAIPDDALAQNVPEYKNLYDSELKKSGDPVKAQDYARQGTIDILARGSATKSAAIMQAVSLIAPSAGGMMANRVAGSTVDVVGNPVSKALNKLGIKAPTLDAKAAQRAADQMAGKKVNRYTGIGSPTLALREGVEEATQEAAMNATVEDTRATASGTDFNADAINQNLGTSFLAGAIMGKGANMAIQGTESTQARAKVQAMYQNKSNIEMAIPVQEQRIAEMQSRTDIDPAVVQEQIQVLETLKQQRAKITEDMTALGLPPTDPSIQAEPPVNPVVDETGQPIEETLTPEDQQRLDEIRADLADAQPIQAEPPKSGLSGVAERANATNPTNVNVSVPPDMTQQLTDQARANMDRMTNELGIKAPSAQPKVELTPDNPEITITPDGTAPVQQPEATGSEQTTQPAEAAVTEPVKPVTEDNLAGEYQHSQIADAKAIVRKTEKGYEIEWSPDDIQSFSGKTAATRVSKALKKEGYQAPIATTTTTQPVEQQIVAPENQNQTTQNAQPEQQKASAVFGDMKTANNQNTGYSGGTTTQYQQTQRKLKLKSDLQKDGFVEVPTKSESLVKYTKVDDIGQHDRVYDKLDGSLVSDRTITQYEGGVNEYGEPFTLKIIRDNQNGKVFEIQTITPDGVVTRHSGGMPIPDAKIIQNLESVADVLPNPTPVRPTKIAKKFTLDDKKPLFSAPRKKPSVAPMDAIKKIQEQRLDRAGLTGKYVRYGGAEGFVQQREDGLYIVDTTGNQDVLIEGGMSGKSPSQLGVEVVDNPSSPARDAQPADIKGFVSDQAKKARNERLKRSRLNGKYVQYGKAEGFVQVRDDGLYVVNTRGNDVRIDDEAKARVIENPQAELTGKRAKTSLFTPPSKMIKPQAEIEKERAKERAKQQAEVDRIAKIQDSAKANQAEMQAFDEVVDLLVMTFGEQQAESILAMIEEKLGSDLSRSALIQEITNEINQRTTVKNAEKAAIDAPNDAARSVTEPSAASTPKTQQSEPKQEKLTDFSPEQYQKMLSGNANDLQALIDHMQSKGLVSIADMRKSYPDMLKAQLPDAFDALENILRKNGLLGSFKEKPESSLIQLRQEANQLISAGLLKRTQVAGNNWKDAEKLSSIIELAKADPATLTTHKDVGEPVEIVTPEVIQDSMRMAAENTKRPISEMKQDLLDQIDQAMKTAKVSTDVYDKIYREVKGKGFTYSIKTRGSQNTWKDQYFEVTNDWYELLGLKEDIISLERADRIHEADYREILNAIEENLNQIRSIWGEIGKVVFDIKGNGKFSVANETYALSEFRKKVAKRFKDPLTKEKAKSDGSSSSTALAIKNLVQDFEDKFSAQNAANLALANGRVAFGGTLDEPIMFGLVEDVSIAGVPMLIGLEIYRPQKNIANAGNWRILDPKTGLFLGNFESSKTAAIKAAESKMKTILKSKNIAPEQLDTLSIYRGGTPPSEVERENAWYEKYFNDPEYRKAFGDEISQVEEQPFVEPEKDKLSDVVKKFAHANWIGDTPKVRHFFNELVRNEYLTPDDAFRERYKAADAKNKNDMIYQMILDSFADDIGLAEQLKSMNEQIKNNRRAIGKNSEGKTVYEDDRGIRSVEIRNGVFDNEDVTIQRMSGGEVKYKAENRTNEFLTVDELPKPQAKSYDFSKMGTVKEQIDTWLSLKRGDVVFDHRGNEVGTLADESVSVGLSPRTARFNRPDGTLESLSLSVVSGGGAPIIASLDARNAINEQKIKRFKTLETNDMRFIGISEFGDGLFEDAQGKRSLVGQATDRFVPEQGDSRRDAYLTIDELNQDRIKTQVRKPTTRTRINPKTEPDVPAESNTAAAPTQTRRQKILVKIDDELDAALDALADVAKQAGGRMNSGVDPTLLAKFLVVGVKASVLFLAKGAIEFSVWAENMIAGLQTKGVEPEQIKPYLKQLYLASKVDVSPEIRKQMTKEDDVLDFDLDTLGLQEDEQQDQDATGSLVDYFYADIKTGSIPTTNLVLKHRAAKYYGVPIGQIDNAQLKTIQESFEAAMARYARDVVQANRDGTASTYEQLVRIYQSQPNLNIRTSTSVENQAYSTPAPLAFIASKMAGIDENSTVYEPTAGNGMLLIAANPKNTTANELEDTRFQNLQSFGVGKVAQGDALKAIESGVVAEKSQDVIITNPPFGSLKDAQGNTTKIPVNGFKIGKIDHLIALDALRAMKDNGSAAIIIGADKVQGGVSTDDRIFFNYLYSNYNVVSHFEVDGGLYARQGASWPVRVIIVKGRQQSEQRSPKEGVIQRVDTWEGVYEQYNKLLVTDNSRESSVSADGANVEQRANEPTTVSTGVSTKPNPADSAGRKSETNADDVNGSPAGDVSTRKRVSGKRNTTTDRINAPDIRPDERTNAQDNLEVGDKRDTGGVTKSPEPSVSGTEPNGAAGKSALTLTDADNQFQVKYTPMSSRKDEGVLIPTNMKQPLMDSLAVLSDIVGDIDQYAANELGYDSVSTLHNALMGLQVDSVASAIYQIKEKNKGIIIADQTGIGKGRQAAAIIRWAEKNGFIPVFVTVKPQLFTDMYYDLADIGSNNIAPFIFNADSAIVEKDGRKIFGNKAKNEYKNAFNDMTAFGKLPDDRNAVFLTYSQIKNKDNKQQSALRSIANRAIFIMDESHNAAGSSSTGIFMQEVLGLSSGVVYLSATYAKRPDNMPLYFKTDMGIAADEASDIAMAMSMGGLPLQTVVSNSLVKAGQLFRRERSYDGVRIDTLIDTKNGKNHEQLSDQVTKALRAIAFADKFFHDIYFKEALLESESSGGSAKNTAGNQADKGVSHTEFSSVVHNFIRQMLLGMKVDRAADEAIQALKEGRKPLIAVENTMGSFLNEYASASGLSEGDSLGNFSYKNVLKRALERSRALIFIDEKGNEERKVIPLKDLSPFTREVYEKTGEIIDNLQVEGLPVSPIDWMRHRIQKAGYTVAEITGRNMAVDYTEPNSPVLSRVPISEQNDKVGTTRAFNDGSLDAIILNVSGSTGISLHSSEKFVDQRQRHMIVAQPAQDINIFMQMLGRIHRTGQVVLPRYTILSLDLPTEKRPTALLNKKMRSLNANTSSNTESATSIKAMDMLNKYGDKIITDFLLENPTLQVALDIEMSEDAANIDIARKATGRMALLSMKEQYKIYSEIEPQYEALIKYLDETNQNDLEPKTIDYAADLMKEAVIVPATDPSTPFGQEAVFGIYRVKPQGVPMTIPEITELAKSNLNGFANGRLFADDLVQKTNANFANYRSTFMGDEENMPDERLEELQTQFIKQESVATETRGWIENTRIGTGWMVKIGGEDYNAIVTNVRTTFKEGSTGNPYSASKWLVTIAVNGALRQVTMPKTEWDRVAQGQIHSDIRQAMVQREDDASIARIITGNLLAAYTKLVGAEGRVITFTKKDGTAEQGILLPRTFTMEANVRQDMAIKDPDQILKVLRSGLADIQRFGLASRRGDIAVNFSDANFIVVVPKSKAMGGKWFLNRALTEITGDFVSQGQKQMIAKIPLRNQEQILKALRYIVGKTPLYVMPSMVDEVRDLLGLGLSNPKMSIANQKPVGISTRKTKNILADRFGQKTIDKLMDDGILEIVQSAADLPASVTSKVGDPYQIEGFYDPSTGKITMVAGNLSADQVVPVLLHELGGHGSFQSMIAPETYDKLMEAFNSMLERGNAIAIKARDRSNASNPSNPQDEYLAYLLSEASTAQNNANKQGVMRFAKRIMSAFKAWVFDKFGVNLRLTPDDMVALAERMINRRNTTPPKGTRSNADGFNPEIDQVRREHEGKPSWMKAPNGKPTNLTERQWLQVRTPSFKAWFGDWEGDPKNASKIVDANGEPMVVYHGSPNYGFSEFRTYELGIFGAGAYFASKKEDAASYSGKGWGTKSGIYEVFINMKKPMKMPDNAFHHDYFKPARQTDIKSRGYDGSVTVKGANLDIEIVLAFDPEQIKSATDNSGGFDPNNQDIRFSMIDNTKDFLAETALRVGFGNKSFREYIGDKLNTMLHLSLIDPQFKVAFTRLQNKLNQVATDSYASIQAAPELLGHIETFKDVVHLVKGINPFTNAARKADMAAAAEALFQGTLVDRKVFTDKELRDYFSLNDYQIKIYRDSRNAIDLALDRATRSAIMKTIMDAGAEYDAHIKPMLSEDLSLDEVNRRARQFMRDMVSERPMGSTEREKAEGIREAVLEQLDGILAKRQKLSDQGYAPLMRFGDYWLTVKNKEDGTTELHQRFESEGEREVALRRLKKGNVLDNAIHEVSTGKDNPERHKLFRGVSPEAMMLFAKELGMEGDDATQAYLRLATANQSALRRLIHRKGIAGYSEDLQRVLAAFVMSSARHSSHMIFNEPILEAIRGIENADHQRQAMDMNEFALNPVEQARVFKNLLFIWNMGASLMFGLINMTQPFTQTFPFLTQEVGLKAVKGIYKGWFAALKSFGSNEIPAEYQAEYERAQREGHLDPANVWMLQGIERGSSGVYHNIWTLIQQSMGFVAQATETVNRRTTLFAALEAAKSMSKEQIEQYGTPYDFAVQAIQETQGIYNKANRPKLSRTWAGDLLMVYKQFSIAYVEQMIRMQRNKKWNGKEDKSPISRGLMLMLGIIFSFAGSMGLPFAQNVADIGSAAFGWAGKPTQFEYEFEKGMQEWLGDDNGKMVADAIKYGFFNLNGVVDVQGRMSMGNLIPATGLLNPAASEFDRNSSVANLFGASGGLSKQMTEAYQLMGMGEYSEAAVRALPRAFTSLAKSSEMLSTGKYTNKAGNVVTDATTFEAIVKALDGNPARVADEQRALMRYYSAKAIRDGVQKRLNDDLLKAKIDGNSEDAAQVAERIRTWNAENPEYRVKINHATLRRKLREQGVANWRDRAPSSKGLEWALEKEDE